MTKTREYLAQRAQLRRKLARKIAEQQLAARRSKISDILVQVSEILLDEEVVFFFKQQRIETAPSCLFELKARMPCEITEAQFADDILAFIVAWKFLFPALSNARLKDLIERKWPSFVVDFKDAFISLVMDGPFLGERKSATRLKHSA